MFERLKTVFHKDADKFDLPVVGEEKDIKYVDLAPELQKVAKMLGIALPKFQPIDYLFISEGMIMGTFEEYKDEIPSDAEFIGGHYLDDQDLAFIAIKIPTYPPDAVVCTLKSRNIPEIFWQYVHMMRYAWQKKYHEDEYYSVNASSIDYLWDPAEIDADAFATAYVFSDCTPYTVEDFPTFSNYLCTDLVIDGGRRWSRIREISDQYGLKGEEKLVELALRTL